MAVSRDERKKGTGKNTKRAEHAIKSVGEGLGRIRLY